jgi:hypothetical protein
MRGASEASIRGLVAGCCVVILAACGPRLASIDTGPPLSDADLAMGWARGPNRDSADFSEQLVLRGPLEDGGEFYVKLVVSNLANADGRAQLTFQVRTGEGLKLRLALRADRGDWRFADDRFEAEVDGVTVRVGLGLAEVRVDHEDVRGSLRLTSPLMPLRPDGGRYDRGGLFYVTTIPLPRAAAELSLEVLEPSLWVRAVDEEDGDGEPAEEPLPIDEPPTEVSLDGVGFVEHRWGNVPPHDLAHRWHTLLVVGDDETVVLSAFERPRGGEAPAPSAPGGGPALGETFGWLFAARDDALVMYAPRLDVRPYRWANDAVTSYPVPGLVYVSDPGGRRIRGVIDLGSLSKRKDDLSGLKKLERIVVRRFMQPWTFTFSRARYLFRAQDPGTQAVDVRGRGMYRVQQIRQ